MKFKIQSTIFSIILIVISSLLIERIVSINDYSISKSPLKITNLKSQSSFVPIMGASEFKTHSNSLFKNRINLEMWHGNNHLVFDNIKAKDSFSFDFNLSAKSVFDISIKNKENGSYKVLRFNEGRLHLIETSHDGEFKSSRFINSQLDKINHFQFKNKNLLINNKKVYSISNAVDLGVRSSGVEKVSIEAIKVNGGDLKLRPQYSLSLIIILSLLLITFSFFLRPLPQVSMALMLCILSTSAHIFYINYYQASYPLDLSFNDGKLLQEEGERDFIKEETKRVASLLVKDQGSTLFIGSSQTFGEGVTKKSKIWTELYCKEQGIINCINIGIRSATSKTFLDLNKLVLNSKPKKIFYILAHNDSDIRLHRKNTEKLIKSWIESNIEVTLILEPTTYQKSPLHFNLINLGSIYNLKVIDMHSYISTVSDYGWYWHDEVHLTDLGHKKFSKRLIEQLATP